MTRGYHFRGTTARMLAAAALRDDLAEHIAKGGTIAGYARATGMTERGAQKAWKAVRDALGAQAV